MKTTASEIAREAGVSSATVDRVLNNRDGVRPRTREIVMQVAARLGYFGPMHSAAKAAVRMDFILPAGSNSFMKALRQHLIEEAQSYGNCDVKIHQIEVFDPGTLAEQLLALRGATDAVGLVALDHPEVREAVNALAQTGVHICTIVSDIPTVHKVGYVGIDNRAAGRLAGLLVGRLLPTDRQHKVALFLGSHAYRGHEEREMGFRSILSEEFPDLTIAALTEVSDDRDLAYEETLRILEKNKINAIYSIGAGNQGIARALQEKGISRKTVFVAHDITEATRVMLIDRTLDAVIDQNPKVQAREVIKLLASTVHGKSEPEYPPRLQVILRENIPSY
ncbi:LacI family DNA-binding transcriptional regulator [Pacificibacter marinus]|uniref:HTH-type transcriptional regulator DegA n=1 Tax=Pacificibacter marinus TaxID=658057 RepID=A0A1Y5RP78_9RHOB|nr:LacI family DNA-binding transcriptional regulator [Pacificibacter marinus]SEL30991.1 transcriptional regulator, LacI family [Pacificibacter marinus]SLN22251.1 HTH-type transcriptional regulator DegA [Pacificibacter marinus]